VPTGKSLYNAMRSKKYVVFLLLFQTSLKHNVKQFNVKMNHIALQNIISRKFAENFPMVKHH
jgi:hypothetical protein